jgi:hypothetical protein
MHWSKVVIGLEEKKYKIIGDNGPIKIIIGGPTSEGKYWWTIKVEEKGESASIEEARQAALDSVKYDLQEINDG